MVGKSFLVILGTVLVPSPVFAQPWAARMFETTSHNFGSIARDAKAEFEFKVKNIFLEDVHIASVRSSCRCTQPRIENPSLKTYEQGAIVARINSRAFRGHQGATVTVTFDKPYYARVQLHVSVHIRSDVVLTPPAADLGSVQQGTAIEKGIAVHHFGRSDWKILGVESKNPYLRGKVVETSRSGGRVAYKLQVSLAEDAPAGYIKDHLILKTSDRSTPEIPVLAEGRVLSSITVSPSPMFIGSVAAGEQVTRHVVVRGTEPFRITAVTCDDGRFSAPTAVEQPAKAIHVVPVTFAAGEEPGRVRQAIRIETDLAGATAELAAYAVVTPSKNVLVSHGTTSP